MQECVVLGAYDQTKERSKMRNAMQYMKKHPNFIIFLLGDEEKLLVSLL